jgi:hypothetical protein
VTASLIAPVIPPPGPARRGRGVPGRPGAASPLPLASPPDTPSALGDEVYGIGRIDASVQRGSAPGSPLVSCERGILASGSGSRWWLMPLTAEVPPRDRAVLLAGPPGVGAGLLRAPGAGFTRWIRAWRRIGCTGHYPRVARLMESGIDPDDPATRDEGFDLGLDGVLGGIAARLAPGRYEGVSHVAGNDSAERLTAVGCRDGGRGGKDGC